MREKVVFIVCWFGSLPIYFNIWLKSCAENIEYTFWIFTDDFTEYELPENVFLIPFTKKEMIERIEKRVIKNCSLLETYRVCNFKPMYGAIFEDKLKDFTFWGYCDLDIIFGKISDFITQDMLQNKDAIFNAGHFTLLRNNKKMNTLYTQKGAIFNYKVVARKNAIFAFDEITGIQRIAKKNGINAVYGIDYIETEIKNYQLRSRMDKINPKYQAFYWENGDLYRVKTENNQIYYQKIAYIHLQKRKIIVNEEDGMIENSFWIGPSGYTKKKYIGKPTIEDIKNKNPYIDNMKKENKQYYLNKIITILKRNPFQIYVRIRQQLAGINSVHGTLEERKWEMY